MTVVEKSSGASKMTSGADFGRALAAHFGLRYVMDVKVNDEPNEVFGATITLALTPEDMEAIGRLMAESP